MVTLSDEIAANFEPIRGTFPLLKILCILIRVDLYLKEKPGFFAERFDQWEVCLKTLGIDVFLCDQFQ